VDIGFLQDGMAAADPPYKAWQRRWVMMIHHILKIEFSQLEFIYFLALLVSSVSDSATESSDQPGLLPHYTDSAMWPFHIIRTLATLRFACIIEYPVPNS